jgi:predicted RNA-binding protein Jag
MNASVDDVREFVAETPAAALALAESFFRTSAAELETWVVPPSVHISGLGARVLMIAAPRSAERSARPAPQREERRDDRGGRGERREERGRGDDRGDRGGRGDRGDRRPRGGDRERSAAPRERGGERGGDRGAERPPERSAERPRERDRERERPREEAPVVAAAAPGEPLTPGRLGPVGEFVTGILERMKVRDVVASEKESDDGEIIVTVGGRGITALAEREPRVVAALSHLAHRAAEALVEGDDAAAQVEVYGIRRAPREETRERGGREGREGRDGRERGRDSRGAERGGGRPRRDPEDRDIDEGELERLAQDSARVVRDTGESQLLPPMNSRERWFVHNALKDERGVRSESEGEGARKRVRIFPA